MVCWWWLPGWLACFASSTGCRDSWRRPFNYWQTPNCNRKLNCPLKICYANGPPPPPPPTLLSHLLFPFERKFCPSECPLHSKFWWYRRSKEFFFFALRLLKAYIQTVCLSEFEVLSCVLSWVGADWGRGLMPSVQYKQSSFACLAVKHLDNLWAP